MLILLVCFGLFSIFSFEYVKVVCTRKRPKGMRKRSVYSNYCVAKNLERRKYRGSVHRTLNSHRDIYKPQTQLQPVTQVLGKGIRRALG